MKYEVRYLPNDVAFIKEASQDASASVDGVDVKLWSPEREVTHAEADKYRKQQVSE
jgi:hypothetical protein